VVDGGHADPTIRPNQILTLALPYRLLEPEKERAVFETVRVSLLTPFGLRSLAPSDPQYRGRYQGDIRARDSAYHQGTVWPWWLGAYGDALLRVEGDTPDARAKVRDLFQAFEGHLGEVGLGTISEVFDGDAPHRPGGCISQAWSVSEILRLLMRVR
jgi:glycogen debranching enzyme